MFDGIKRGIKSIIPVPPGFGGSFSLEAAKPYRLPFATLTDVVEDADILRKRDVFRKAMRMAADATDIVSKSDTPDSKHHIRSLINAFGRRLQYSKLTECIFAEEEGRFVSEPEMFVHYDTTPLGSLHDLMERVESNTPIELSRTIVLPWPWHEQRYVSAISRIATGHPDTEWRTDPLNHSVDFWLPLEIGFVHGGNHSITSGILAGQGMLIPENTYDITPLYPLIDTDGAFFFTSDGTIIATVTDVELAIVYGLGKYLVD